MGIKPRAGESPLSKLRVKVGMTQKQLAEKVGCSVSLIKKLEQGKRSFRSTHLLFEFASILYNDNGVRIANILELRENMVNYWRKKKNER